MIPQKAIELAKRFEGFHKVVQHKPMVMAAPYICPAGYWTIGYGHLCDKTHYPITEPEAEMYLEKDLMGAYRAVKRLCPVAMNDNQLAALIDFTFNLGAGRLQTSTLRQRVLERNWIEAQREIKRWVYGGGRILPGLVIRREANAALLR